ncbi:GvpL/GvpF family gas vesicle protein [Spirillospora sp. CA-294931]|uniref:GvpL/GvpF family gas vesicle protein n=1 Tax=Spirillospora sp. CA-294931 TaxID=3240042 RepID=UPI003D8E0B05
MTAPHAALDGAAAPPAPQYVYGITRSGITLPEGLTGLDERPVRLIEHGPCAAVTGDLPQNRPLGERADLIAHERVLESLVNTGVAVLPFRFGAALAAPAAVREELLAGNADRLTEIVDRVDGHVELRLRGSYVQETVLREVLSAEPQIADLNRALRDLPEDATHYERIRLGELIAQALRARRDQDAQAVMEVLEPAAEAVVRRPPAREEDVLDAAFLVRADRREAFADLVAGLARDHDGRVRLRLVGPLPPYDFVPEA